MIIQILKFAPFLYSIRALTTNNHPLFPMMYGYEKMFVTAKLASSLKWNFLTVNWSAIASSVKCFDRPYLLFKI